MDDIATIDSIQPLVIHQNVKWGTLESTAHDVRGVTQAEYKKTNPGHGKVIVDSWKRFRDSNLRNLPNAICRWTKYFTQWNCIELIFRLVSAYVTPGVMYCGISSTDFTFCHRIVFVGSSEEYILKLHNCCIILIMYDSALAIALYCVTG